MEKRKVFISWSKTPANDVALGFKRLLLHMFDNVEPWVSADGIDVGSLGTSQIHRQLADTTFGILIITSKNQSEPWLNYEAGALAKTVDIDGDQARVVPLLVDFDNLGQLRGGPIANLQGVIANEEGVRKVVQKIGEAVEAGLGAIASRWAYGWVEFEKVLNAAKETLEADGPTSAPRSVEEMLEEILATTRQQRSSPLSGLNAVLGRAEEQALTQEIVSFLAYRGVAVGIAEARHTGRNTYLTFHLNSEIPGGLSDLLVQHIQNTIGVNDGTTWIRLERGPDLVAEFVV